MIKIPGLIICLSPLICYGCMLTGKKPLPSSKLQTKNSVPSLIILGTVQDAGSPHIACKKECCRYLFEHPDKSRKVVSIGLTDPVNKMNWIFEATPDLPDQMNAFKKYTRYNAREIPDGIFLTHAHIGHYTGLMYFGKEAMYAKKMPVYALPQMKKYLENNGPWSQLVSDQNIDIRLMRNREEIKVSEAVKVTPFTVPHRDEYSETAGYIIQGPNKKALFIPDIDKWEKWDKNIIEEIRKVDYALIDATFYDGPEINNRDISEIPHPFVIESMETFKDLSPSEKNKIYFIHFNHTNPLLNNKSTEYKNVLKNGFHVAEVNQVFGL